MKKTQKRLMALVLGMALMFGLIVIPSYESKAEGNYSFSGMAHVQTYGDKAGTWDGTTLKLGTTGQAKRLESVTIKFENNTGYDGSIEYRVHRQTYGWTEWVGNGQAAGTTGQGKRLEGIQIRLTGELANHYSVKYRVHIQTYGWNQGWQYDGALAGTEAEAKRLESLEIQLVPKKSETMNVIYRVHRQTYGWETAYKKNGEVSGTTGQGKRLEGIEIALTGNEYNGSILYNTHVQSYGWMDEVENGMMSGTSGKAKRLEAIKIRLSGEVADHYDVYYRVHAQSYGWLGWAKNGQEAGTSGQAKRLEAIQIVLVKKGSSAPGNVGNITSMKDVAYVTGSTQTPNTQAPSTSEKPTPNTCAHDWKANTVHFDAVTHTEFLLNYEKAKGKHEFCNSCKSDTMIQDDDPYRCHFCKCPGFHGSADSSTWAPYVWAVEEIDKPECNYIESYTCSKCGKTIENTSAKQEIEEQRKCEHEHSWEPVYGEHHDSMVIRGSYRTGIEIVAVDECAKCGINFLTFFNTTTLETYKSNLRVFADAYKYNNKTRYVIAGTANGLNEKAIEHLQKCYGTQDIITCAYDEVIGYKCKTCGATKTCDDKDIAYKAMKESLLKDIEYSTEIILNSGNELPMDLSLMEYDKGLELHNGCVYRYATLNGNKEYIAKYVDGIEDYSHRLDIAMNFDTGIGSLMCGYEVIYRGKVNLDVEPQIPNDIIMIYCDGQSVSLGHILEAEITQEFVRFVHQGDYIYKYKIVNGELGDLIQIYDKYGDPIE